MFIVHVLARPGRLAIWRHVCTVYGRDPPPRLRLRLVASLSMVSLLPFLDAFIKASTGNKSVRVSPRTFGEYFRREKRASVRTLTGVPTTGFFFCPDKCHGASTSGESRFAQPECMVLKSVEFLCVQDERPDLLFLRVTTHKSRAHTDPALLVAVAGFLPVRWRQSTFTRKKRQRLFRHPRRRRCLFLLGTCHRLGLTAQRCCDCEG
jgi:hypothetical protein